MKHKATPLFALSILVCVGIGCSWMPAFIGDRGELKPSFALSPDGKQMALSANDGDLYLIELGSKGVRRLTETPAYEKTPSFSPDGKSLLYVSEPDGDRFSSRVFRIQIDTREITQLTKESGICDNNPHFSPDGSRIAFARASRNNGDPYVRDLWNDYDLYVMNADGSGQKRITSGLYQRELDVRFSADGSELIFNGMNFQAGGSTTSAILKTKANGSDRSPSAIVPPLMEQDKFEGIRSVEYTGLDISPDGKSILYQAGEKFKLFDMTTNSVTDVPLEKQQNNVNLSNPAFTSNGLSVWAILSVYISKQQSEISILSFDINGSNQKKIADNTLFANPLEWKQ